MRLNGRFGKINFPQTEEETVDFNIARTAPIRTSSKNRNQDILLASDINERLET